MMSPFRSKCLNEVYSSGEVYQSHVNEDEEREREEEDRRRGVRNE